ncbi:hypothetical protein B0G84_5705 [Paraburkholderia sp. BL8N3]|nr:hypothetical protein [Paraburkholderia sp. BL8N3]TCK36692.1 hypothetical protein B0G84_5705 [Paraburkholderia sp. BL8N3]
MSTQQPPNDWPAEAVPQAWVEELFRKLTAYFGARFADLWRGVDIDDIKREWGIALAKLSRTEMKAGVAALLSLKYPPTLPEFFAACKQARLHEMPKHDLLTDQTRAAPEVVEASLHRMSDATAPLSISKEPTAEWAFAALMRGLSRSGKPLSAEVIRCATDAISSGAGRRVVESCTDAELRESYAAIREAVLIGYGNAGKKLWGAAA